MDQVSGTAGQLLFSTTTGGTLSEAMRIESDGTLQLAGYASGANTLDASITAFNYGQSQVNSRIDFMTDTYQNSGQIKLRTAFGATTKDGIIVDEQARVTMPYQPMSSHSTAVGSTADQVLPASSVQVNNGGHLSTSTNSGRFTAPVAGYYKCIFTGYTNYSGGYGYVNLRKNGAQQGYSIHWNHSGYQLHTGVSLNQVVYCSVNDYLAFHSFGGSSWLQGGTVAFELIG